MLRGVPTVRSTTTTPVTTTPIRGTITITVRWAKASVTFSEVTAAAAGTVVIHRAAKGLRAPTHPLHPAPILHRVQAEAVAAAEAAVAVV